ncbi:MAG: VIT1/CCC1 transporter family protein [Leptospirales bacterium]
MKSSKPEHTEVWHSPKGKRIREIVLGMNDGIVTVVGFLGGLTGSAFSTKTVLFSGIMTGLAGALSMFLGGYLSAKSQSDFFRRERDREWNEIQEVPHIERQEVYEILLSMGFTEEESRIFRDRITENPKRWHDFMMKEELGILSTGTERPLSEGAWLGLSFLAGSIPPIIPYAFLEKTGSAFNLSLVFSLLALGLLGILKSRLTRESFLRGAGEMMILGGIAALLGLFMGTMLPRLMSFHP